MIIIIGNNLKKLQSTWIPMIEIAGIKEDEIKIFSSWKGLIKEKDWLQTVKLSKFILLDHHLYPEDEITEENETNGREIFFKFSEISLRIANKIYGISTEFGSQDYLAKEKYLGNKDPDKVFRLFEQLRRAS